MIEIRINDRSGQKKHTNYIGWSPRPAWIRQSEGSAERTVNLKNGGIPGGGRVTFFSNAEGGPDVFSSRSELSITLPPTGGDDQWVLFFVAGEFNHDTGVGFASNEDEDTGISVFEGSDLLYTSTLMVRVRKNANKLSANERKDFLEAIMYLNTSHGGELPWKNLQDMHVPDTSAEIHGRSCFLPWHRSFLLNLEREIQALEIEQRDGTLKSYAHVTIPYWDMFAKNETMFNTGFLGFPDRSGVVHFDAKNPLVNWKTNLTGSDQVILGPKLRRAHKLFNLNDYPWNPDLTPSPIYTIGGDDWGWAKRTEYETLHDSDDYNVFANEGLEGSPHGAAHVSWGGPLMRVGWSPADPLFYMLHCNIDRLWAKWQWITPGYRFDSTDKKSYDRQGHGSTIGDAASPETIGNYTKDTMWPWDGDNNSPRPNQANWGGLPDSPTVSAPGSMPRVEQMIDYHGQLSQDPSDYLGFDYDDIPLDFPDSIV
ncbi:MAG: tyrosinase family protein [Crocinitomicaceae bacterium]|nr:tyrosinase family protein [Crocinitomicaceae bacterium]